MGSGQEGWVQVELGQEVWGQAVWGQAVWAQVVWGQEAEDNVYSRVFPCPFHRKLFLRSWHLQILGFWFECLHREKDKWTIRTMFATCNRRDKGGPYKLQFAKRRQYN